MRKIISILLVLCVILSNSSVVMFAEQEQAVSNIEFQYLSDIEPIYAKAGYVDKIKNDVNIDDGKLSLIVDGRRKYFDKGVAVHADGEVIYDLGSADIYERLETYLGVDASKEGGGSVQFFVYTSADNSTWTNIFSSNVLTSSSEAAYLDVSIKGARYLKFVFNKGEDNVQDHSVLCSPAVYTGDINNLTDSQINSVGYFDKMFDGLSYDEIYSNHKLDLLRRALVERSGYALLCNYFFTGEQANSRREMINWLWNDEKALTDLITGGEPNGTMIDALTVLTTLYSEFKTDLDSKEELFEPEDGSTRTRGDVYRTMMIAIALTHANGVYSWLNENVASDPIERYTAFKNTYLDSTYHLRREYFENLCVEEMRYVMSNRIWNDEIYWLNAYLSTNSEDKTYPAVYSPHPYMTYGKDWDYEAKGFFDEANYDTYNQKYNLTNFGVKHPTNYTRLWMVLETEHICWGISYVGTNFATAFGVPSHYVRQEGHSAFIVYNRDDDNRTVWYLDNNVAGWALTWLAEDVSANGSTRMLCDWGTIDNGWSSDLNATYVMLASTALDDQANYEKAELYLTLNSLAKSRKDEEQLYRRVLNIQSYHLDAWYLLASYYANSKTDIEKVALTGELTDKMKFFPLPMYDLVNILKNSINASEVDTKSQLAQVVSYEQRALEIATEAESNSTATALLAQPDVCAIEAKYLLNVSEGLSEVLATFSFNGADAGCLVFNSIYAGARYRYSLDNGESWSQLNVTTTENLKYKFTDEEINSITSANDIRIWIEGWATETGDPITDNAFVIDILDGQAISGIEPNDNEDRILGDVSCMKYSLDGENWYELTNDIKFEGTKTVNVIKYANGVTLDSPMVTYKFTDNNTDKRSYITIDRLEVADCSSEETEQGDNQAKYVIDGLNNTFWHTSWDRSDSDRYIVIMSDKPTYFSGVTCTAREGNGLVIDCTVYVSLDGESWTEVYKSNGLGGNSISELTFTPTYGKYVKFVVNNGLNGFAAARSIDLFEDTTFTVEEDTLYGDVNGDKVINYIDATMILQYYAGIIQLNDKAMINADVNLDNVVDSVDATVILQYYAGIIIKLN